MKFMLLYLGWRAHEDQRPFPCGLSFVLVEKAESVVCSDGMLYTGGRRCLDSGTVHGWLERV